MVQRGGGQGVSGNSIELKLSVGMMCEMRRWRIWGWRRRGGGQDKTRNGVKVSTSPLGERTRR